MKINVSISEGLRLDKENIRQAKGNKHAGTIIIDPMDFLRLTTPGDSYIKEILDESLTLKEYNDFSRNGSSIHMPWLDVSVDGIDRYRDWIKRGSVIGHEGRHRAAALINKGINKIPISVCLYRKGKAERYKTTDDDPWSKNPWTRNDIPKVLYGEFDEHRTAKIDVNTFKPFKT